MEQTGASMDIAREWVGEVFARVGRSFRDRRTQSVSRRANIASFYNRQNQRQSQRRRNSELENLKTEGTYFSRLKSYWLPAFQQYNDSINNEWQSSPKNEEGFHLKSNASLEMKNEMKTTRTHSSSRCSVSVSVTNLDESKPNLCLRRKSETIHTEIIQKVSVKNENQCGCLVSQQKASTDSGVSMTYNGSFDEQQSFEDEQHSSRYWWREEIENTKQNETVTDSEEKESEDEDSYKDVNDKKDTAEKDLEETFSKNYSVFCEKLNNIQKKSHSLSDQTCTAKFQFFSCHRLSSVSTKTKCTSVLRDTSKPDGVITISLQHFQKSRQLRIILLSLQSSVENNRKMFCKVTLTGNRTTQKEKSRKVLSKNGNADIKETFYMNSSEDLIGYVLKIQIRTVSKILKRQSVACEAYIALEDIDLDLDTTMTVKMHDPKTSKQVKNEDIVDVISENRSIHAEATALLYGMTDRSNFKMIRQLSLPHLRYDSVIPSRCHRAMTLESKVRSKTLLPY